MAQRKYKERNIRNLTKTGGHSIGLTIPIDVIRELGWKERQKVVVRKVGDKLVVKDWKEK